MLCFCFSSTSVCFPANQKDLSEPVGGNDFEEQTQKHFSDGPIIQFCQSFLPGCEKKQTNKLLAHQPDVVFLKLTIYVYSYFKEDVDSFMKQPGNETADVVLKKLDEQYQKYKFMELNLAQKKRRLVCL